MDYDQAVSAEQDGLEYLQAAGRADRLTVEIRKAGHNPWGADYVRYVVGHSNVDGDEPLDAPIVLPASTEMVAPSEIFEADEAAALFYRYFQSGDIPSTYTLRAVAGYTKDGGLINLLDATT